MLRVIYSYALSRYRREKVGEVIDIIVDFVKFVKSKEYDNLVEMIKKGEDGD